MSLTVYMYTCMYLVNLGTIASDINARQKKQKQNVYIFSHFESTYNHLNRSRFLLKTRKLFSFCIDSNLQTTC